MPYRMLMGGQDIRSLAALPAEAPGDVWQRMISTPGWLFSSTLETTDWPGLKIVRDDLVSFARGLKRHDGPELRTLGNLSLIRQLLAAGLVDCLKLVVCPLVLPQTGAEPIFAALPDTGFDLLSTKVLDERVLLLEYRPTGAPPYRA
jgi:dihydrofolate reductase